MKEWQKVFETDNPHRAEIVKYVLESTGIGSIILNKKDSSYNNFGFYQVMVSNEDVLKSIKLIENDVSFE